MHFEDSQLLSAAEVLRTGGTFGIDVSKWLISSNSERILVDHCAAPIRGDDDQLIGAVVVIRDASERFPAEESLRVSEERFRKAFDRSDGRQQWF